MLKSNNKKTSRYAYAHAADPESADPRFGVLDPVVAPKGPKGPEGPFGPLCPLALGLLFGALGPPLEGSEPLWGASWAVRGALRWLLGGIDW